MVRIFLSGIHSDPDPSAGIGVARSIRLVFPNASLVGVDYSPLSTGIHSGLFDDIWIHRPWNELDLVQHAEHIARLVEDQHTYWLSNLDVEVQWISQAIARHRRLLVPTGSAAIQSRKPAADAARRLGMKVPPFIHAGRDSWQLHRFGRAHDWDIWVKSRHHDARRAVSWSELRTGISHMSAHWGLQDVFVQANVAGSEQCLAFAAFEGRLLVCAAVEKRLQVAGGKTWAADVGEVDGSLKERLSAFVHETAWTGGGEVEFIRTPNGDRVLIDFNPRFPAYIHGITLCGLNLPAALLAAVTQQTAPSNHAPSGQFARIVMEVAVHPSQRIPAAVVNAKGQATSSKHPSFQPQLVRRMRGQSNNSPERPSFPLPAGWQWAVKQAWRHERTPIRLEIPGVASCCLRRTREVLGRFAEPTVHAALSVKTLPHPRIAQTAREEGWWVEVVSDAEAAWAMRLGFSPNRIVFNGPLTRVSSFARSVAVVFHDSVESLRAQHRHGPIPGVRLRLPGRSSRFGVDLQDLGEFHDLSEALLRMPREEGDNSYALQFHLASDAIGIGRWSSSFDVFLAWSVQLAQLVGRGPRLLDCGGGWHPDDFDEFLNRTLPRIWKNVRAQLPSVEMLVVEPGKAVTGPAFLLLSTVVEVRRVKHHGGRDVVIDASIADIPTVALTPHRILLCSHTNRTCTWLGPGSDRLLGGICMESDIIEQSVGLPSDIAPGDRVVVFDAGAYDASMAWDFARGAYRDCH